MAARVRRDALGRANGQEVTLIWWSPVLMLAVTPASMVTEDALRALSDACSCVTWPRQGAETTRDRDRFASCCRRCDLNDRAFYADHAASRWIGWVTPVKTRTDTDQTRIAVTFGGRIRRSPGRPPDLRHAYISLRDISGTTWYFQETCGQPDSARSYPSRVDTTWAGRR
jgi:hypothetical protein